MLKSMPAFYQRAFPGELKSLLLVDKPETLANCGTCTLDLKCCTYYPFWVNFMIGDFLDGGVAGDRALVAKLFEDKAFILPLGMVAPPAYQYKYNLAEKPYGEDETLLCPLYDNGQCSIWPSRPSECTRFHCKSRFGVQGIQWWQGLGDYLHHFEMRMAQEILLELGYAWKEIEEQMALVKLDTKKPGFKKLPAMSPKLQAHYWKHKEPSLEFFVRAREIALEKCESVLRESPELIAKGAILKHNFFEMVKPS